MLKSPRIWWWLATDAALGVGVYWRRGFVFTQNPSLPDLILFAVFIGNSLLPLFREIEFWGLKLKPELDRLAGEVEEVKHSINLLHAQVVSAISLRMAQSSTFNLLLPLSDSALKQLKDQAAPELESQLKTSKELSMNIDEGISRLATIHLEVAKELRRLCQSRLRPDYPAVPPETMVGELETANVLTRGIAGLTRQVLAIAVAGLGGQPMTTEQSSFIGDMGPKVVLALKGTPS